MKSLLLCIAVTMMFSGGQSYSESKSCSTVNGVTICNSEKGNGNVAGSSASALTGNGRSLQDSYAMTGDSRTGRGQEAYSQRGYPSNGGFGPSQYSGYGPQGSNYGYGQQGSNYGQQGSSYSSSGAQAASGAASRGAYSGAQAASGAASRGAYSGAQAVAGAGAGFAPNFGFDPFAFAGIPNPLFGGTFAFAG